jgi:hypothetical protein
METALAGVIRRRNKASSQAVQARWTSRRKTDTQAQSGAANEPASGDAAKFNQWEAV